MDRELLNHIIGSIGAMGNMIAILYAHAGDEAVEELKSVVSAAREEAASAEKAEDREIRTHKVELLQRVASEIDTLRGSGRP